MNIIEAFNAVTAGERVQYVLTGREVVTNSHGSLCWRNTGNAVLTYSDTCKNDAFKVIEPTWKKATLREAFAALAEGKTIGNDRDMLMCEYHLTDDDILVNRHGDRVDVLSDEFEHRTQWYILEND